MESAEYRRVHGGPTKTRRALIAGVGTVLTAGLAGCLGVLDDPIEFRATPARIPRRVLDSADYREVQTVPDVVTETAEAFGQSRTIRVTNWLSEYERSVDLVGLTSVQVAVVAVLTTPQVRVLGREFNYVSEYTHADLVTELQGRYDDVENVRPDGEWSVALLDSATTVGRYAASARRIATGASIPVTLHVTDPVAHDGDYVICVGVHPRGVGREESQVETLFRRVEHEG